MLPLVYNPAAAGGRGRRRMERARQHLRAWGVDVAPRATSGPGGAADAVRDAAREGAARVLVLGGDGTLSEAAHGALTSGRDVELGFLPGGTGNSFLQDFGMHRLDVAAQRVARGEPRRVDVARVSWAGGERHVLSVFGIGFMALVSDHANRKLKGWGSASYTLAVFPELARFRAPRTRLALDGEVVEEPLALVAVCNTQRMGGAMRVAPMARHDDGLLDVLALRDVSKRELLAFLPRLFRGTHVPDPRVLVRQARRVDLAPAEPSPLLLDGEVMGETPATVEALPGALRLVA